MDISDTMNRYMSHKKENCDYKGITHLMAFSMGTWTSNCIAKGFLSISLRLSRIIQSLKQQAFFTVNPWRKESEYLNY